jgi:hypothetical protein
MRITSTLTLALFAAWGPLHAEDFGAKHVHLHGSEAGTLTIDDSGVAFKESKLQKHPHEYRWAWDDIQLLTLSPDHLDILTYKDVKWLLGRDQAFAFTGIDLDRAYPTFRAHLPRRFVPEVANLDFDVREKIPAKRLEGRSGWEGELLFGPDQIVFHSAAEHGSHTWILEEVENVSSSDPLELTISSLGRDYRMQLKRALPEALYSELWRRLNVGRSSFGRSNVEESH